MTDKIKQALDAITKLQEKAQKLYDSVQEDVWPKNGDKYFFLLGNGEIDNDVWENDYRELGGLSIGNIFRTKGEADRHLEKLKVTAELKRIAGGYKFIAGENNWFIIKGGGKLDIVDSFSVSVAGVTYMTNESAQQALDTLGDRLHVLFD